MQATHVSSFTGKRCGRGEKVHNKRLQEFCYVYRLGSVVQPAVIHTGIPTFWVLSYDEWLVFQINCSSRLKAVWSIYGVIGKSLRGFEVDGTATGHLFWGIQPWSMLYNIQRVTKLTFLTFCACAHTFTVICLATERLCAQSNYYELI
jgi:hypothetical protein